MSVTLLVVQGKPAGKKLVFPTGEFYIGRGVECHVRPDSEWVSRQHCVLRVTGDAVYVQDLGSRNGTLVNGELVTSERQLWPGDLIQIGPLVFEVRLDAAHTPTSLPRRTPMPTKEVQHDPTVETMPKVPGPEEVAQGDAVGDSTENHPILPPEEVESNPKKE